MWGLGVSNHSSVCSTDSAPPLALPVVSPNNECPPQRATLSSLLKTEACRWCADLSNVSRDWLSLFSLARPWSEGREPWTPEAAFSDQIFKWGNWAQTCFWNTDFQDRRNLSRWSWVPKVHSIQVQGQHTSHTWIQTFTLWFQETPTPSQPCALPRLFWSVLPARAWSCKGPFHSPREAPTVADHRAGVPCYQGPDSHTV